MRLIILFFFIFSFFCLNAQDCPPGSVTITSQAEMDVFAATYPNCTQINGHLTLNGEDDYSSIYPNLPVLKRITGSLAFYANSSASGFPNLEYVGGISDSYGTVGTFPVLDTIGGAGVWMSEPYGGLGFPSCPQLKYIGGSIQVSSIEGGRINSNNFPNVEYIGGDIRDYSDWADSDFSGFSNLRYVGGNIDIEEGEVDFFNTLDTIGGDLIFRQYEFSSSPLYIEITGLNQLEYIGGNFRLLGYEDICAQDLSGLSQLNYIGGDFEFYWQYQGSGGGDGCPNGITNLDGLQELEHIGGKVRIGQNDILDLDFLTSLESVGGNLEITYNGLQNIEGLNHVIDIGGELMIEGNSNLSECAVQAVCDYINSNGVTIIADNMVGCNSVQEVEAFCNVCTSNFVFTTQQEIDNFPVNYPECIHIEGNVTINGITSTEINNLDGLSEILSVSDTIFIIDNQALIDISGLENIDHAELNHVQISGNSMLSSCSIKSLCKFIGGEGTTSIYDNSGNCNSETEILDNCAVCPDGPIYLYSQAEVDEFPILYPNCNNILYPIEIKGNNINNLNSLIQIKQMEDCLTVRDCPALTNLSGLDNLESADCLTLRDNGLTDISALSNLTTVQNAFRLWNNSVDLAVLENLRYAGDFSIRNNSILTDLSALSSLDSLGNIYLYDNDNLVSLNGLQSFTEMGDITLRNNTALTSLNGLNNITRADGVKIESNVSIQSLEGFNNLTEVSYLSIGSYGSYGNTTLQSLSGLDNLETINGSLHIGRSEQLNNLEGLNSLTSIGGGFTIFDNSALNNLSGLENLIAVGGNLTMVYNYALASLEGLNNLEAIDGDLKIGYETAGIGGGEAGNSVQDISALSSLTSINGELHIVDNDNLTTLNFENLNHNTITHLIISWNANLSMCHAPVICDYLNAGGSSSIFWNDLGCYNEAEVETSCAALPIEITDPLRVHLNNKTAVLQWRTATEMNNSGFEIQRSKDGIEWERIGWQEGQGNTTTPQTYSYRDPNPIFGTSYYRLKQVDFNGDAEYSNVVSLRYIRNGVTVYPNPVKERLSLHTDYGAIQQIVIYDSTGRQVNQIAKPLNNIDVSILPKGIYIIKITLEDEDFYEKIIVE